MDNSKALPIQMGKLTIVTPPSMIKPKDISFMIRDLNDEQKETFTNKLNKFFPTNDITIFVCDKLKQEDKWFKAATSNSEYVITGDKDVQEQIETIKEKHDRRKFSL